jgi:N-acetyl sugar amidotransferase
MSTGKREAYFGLPSEVVFCKLCVMSNQRPSSYPEFKHTRNRITPTMKIGEDGVCDACRYNEWKRSQHIDWETREKELLVLLDKHRRNDGSFDCVLPGSGGKDSVYAAHVLRYKYGMNPLTVTWPPLIYTDIGWTNFRNWLEIGGFENISWRPNGRVHRLLTRLAIENLLHPFQTFILGQKNLPPKIAAKFDIPLVFYGENEAEYGNPIADNANSLRDKSFYTYSHLDELYLGGLPVKQLLERNDVTKADLAAYLPAPAEELARKNVEVHYLGYYLKWTPQEAYYYSVENAGFHANPFRTEGTYSKHLSLDDRCDGLHFYTTFVKFGIGRASYEAAQEIRNRHLTREEGLALVKRFDGEFPSRYFQEIMDFLEMKPDDFLALVDSFRSPHLWERRNGDWKLRHTPYDA